MPPRAMTLLYFALLSLYRSTAVTVEMLCAAFRRDWWCSCCVLLGLLVKSGRLGVFDTP